MSAPTLEETLVLEQFRKEVSDFEMNEEDRTDMFLLRWLRARDLNIRKATEMLRKSLEWRKAQDIDHILDWSPPPAFVKDYKYDVVGMDTGGQPIVVVPFGKWDIRKVMGPGDRDSWLRLMDQRMVRVFQQVRENSKVVQSEVTQVVLIVDFEQFSIRQVGSVACVDSILEVVRRLEANYPESFYAAYVVNASWIFEMLFSIVKPLLTTRTLSKIHIYSSPSRWKPILLNNLPNNQIPIAFGGTGQNQKDQELTEVCPNEVIP